MFGAELDAAFRQSVTATALDRLETHLDGRAWLAADRPTIADVAVYSYVAHAPESNVSLAPYPRVRSLLARIEALQGFTPMAATRIGLAA